MKKYIKAKYIVTENEIVEDKALLVEDGKIVDLVDDMKLDVEVEDLGEKIIGPGLVDTHVHGMLGCDIMDLKEESVKKISEGCLSVGVTSFLPTTLTSSFENTRKACEVVGKVKGSEKGAKIRGIFLEGPFFTEKHKGAQNPSYFMDPNIDYLKQWNEASNGLIKKIAIAPERDNSVEFIKECVEMGITVALGHSDATYEQAKKAVESGAKIFVHAYNGMSPLHHREPGMVGASMNLKDVYAELICDGHHVNPVALNIMMNQRGRDEIILITDCMMAGLMEEGQYKLGEFDVIVKDGTARLESGSLAGSVLKLKDAVKNVYDWNLADVFYAITMATRVPAQSVGIDDVCGIIKKGYDCDLAVFDTELNLTDVYLNGEKVK